MYVTLVNLVAVCFLFGALNRLAGGAFGDIVEKLTSWRPGTTLTRVVCLAVPAGLLALLIVGDPIIAVATAVAVFAGRAIFGHGLYQDMGRNPQVNGGRNENERGVWFLPLYRPSDSTFKKTVTDIIGMATVHVYRMALLVGALALVLSTITAGSINVTIGLLMSLQFGVGVAFAYLIGWYVSLNLKQLYLRAPTEWAEYFVGMILGVTLYGVMHLIVGR